MLACHTQIDVRLALLWHGIADAVLIVGCDIGVVARLQIGRIQSKGVDLGTECDLIHGDAEATRWTELRFATRMPAQANGLRAM